MPEKPHGQRRLVDHSPKGCKESDMTKSNYAQKKYNKKKLIHIMHGRNICFEKMLVISSRNYRRLNSHLTGFIVDEFG